MPVTAPIRIAARTGSAKQRNSSMQANTAWIDLRLR
jgi:hypothetical protein